MADNLGAGTEEVEEAVQTEDTGDGATLETGDSKDLSDATSENTEELETEEVYYDLDGEEVSLADLRKWKSEGLMQSDYTKKTQALASERKTVEQERLAIAEKTTLLSDLEKGIEQLVMGDLTEARLSELLETNPAEYLRAKKRMEERQGSLSKLAEKHRELQTKVHAENYKRLHNALEWDTDGKKDADLKSITAFAERKGVTQAEFNQFTHPAIMEAFVMAEKYLKLQDGKPDVVKRVKQAPKIVKPNAAKTPAKASSLADRMYGRK